MTAPVAVDDRRLEQGIAMAVAALIGGLYLLEPAPAAADNCSGLTDCFGTADGAGIALIATLFSTALDFIPFVGDVKGVLESTWGRDLITGRKLTKVERALGLIGLSELRHLRHLDTLADLRKPGSLRRSFDERQTAKIDRALRERWNRRPSALPPPGSGTRRSDTAWPHIKEGEIRGNKVTGGHSRKDFESVPGSRVTDARSPDRDGVYTGRIERDRLDEAGNVRKHDGAELPPATKGTAEHPHTFFPDDWPPERIERAIDDAYGSARIDPSNPSRWYGYSSEGVKITGYRDPTTGQVRTAFPERLPDIPDLPPGRSGQIGRGVGDAIGAPDAVDHALSGAETEE